MLGKTVEASAASAAMNRAPGNPRPILVVLILAGACYAFAQTLVVPAIPEISEATASSRQAASWLVTGLMLTAAVATPIVGKLGDMYGKRRVLIAVLITFSLAGVVGAVTNSIAVMIAGRSLQGVAAGVFPLIFGIVRDSFPPEAIPSGLALTSTLFGIGGALGLPLSGLITDHLGVAWLYWISLVGLPIALFARLAIPELEPQGRGRIDWPGAAILSAGLLSVLLAVTQSSEWGWGSPETLGLAGAGAFILVAWWRFEARRDDPLMDVRLLRDRAIASTNITAFFVGFGLFATFLLVPQVAQVPVAGGYGLGLSVTEAGMLLLPCATLQLVAGSFAGRAGAAFGFRAVLGVGAGLCAAALALLAMRHGTGLDLIAAGTLAGIGVGLSFAAMANLIVNSVPQHEVGIGTAINTVTRTVGGALGAAVATALVATKTPSDGGAPAADAYTLAFGVCACIAVIAVATAMMIPRQRSTHAVVPAET